MKGCLFHFGQTLFKNLKMLDLVKAYLNDPDPNCFKWYK